LILVVGDPATDAQVPAIVRRPLEEIATFLSALRGVVGVAFDASG
jgi:hypothetical protein